MILEKLLKQQMHQIKKNHKKHERLLIINKKFIKFCILKIKLFVVSVDCST